eukprot:TRINITY_DN1264_c0_g1_i12.p4 TRINITY_DN1264_c0_g1~~TRINITY_DN1264_c0_g1_i12.p4  ORF type:complete len:113 (-),score=34.05 TRINITY_DN1264_c0_g1_i12:1221-1559(-)
MTAALVTLADLEVAWRSLGADLGVAELDEFIERRELVQLVVAKGLDRAARGSWLLVFDNVESLTDELRELMPVWAEVETPRAHVMVTTDPAGSDRVERVSRRRDRGFGDGVR